MKEVIMQVKSFSADYPKSPIYVGDLVRCKDCRYQVHCHQTVSHTKIHDGFNEYWVESVEFCSKGERREP